MFLKTLLLTFIFTLLNIVLKVYGEAEIYGDIYPTSWDLTVYGTNANFDNKCYKEQPAFYFQTKEHIPIVGNGSSPYYQRLEVCCEGYTRSFRNWEECIPDCSAISPDNCRHGFCRSPHKCECFEGFVKNAKGKCVQTCPISCENGRCLLDDTCVCKPGYILDAVTRRYCIPDCSHVACGLNQKCLAPGECVCSEGFKWLENLGCQPICMPHCGHGRCIAPNQCECFAGFIKRPGSAICEAECYMNCDNGFCESRYKCLCHVGFIFDARLSSCIPHCPDSCHHGVCIAPGICKCFEGYNLQDNNCIPICENGCGFYGRCIAPNVCACGSDLQRCSFGSCSPTGRCLCPTGMSHFIDKCIIPGSTLNIIYNYSQREFYNKQLGYEFNALIGRMFKF